MNTYENDITACLNVLKKGGTILYPTDTIWGIGCLATDDRAIQRVHEIKNRPMDKKLILLVSDLEMLQQHVGLLSEAVLEKISSSEKPTTIIYPQGKSISGLLLSETGSIAIRIVKDEFCRKLIENLGAPITSTSANLSDEKTPSNFEEISDAIKSGVDYTVKYRQSDNSANTPSRILLYKNNSWVEIRS